MVHGVMMAVCDCSLFTRHFMLTQQEGRCSTVHKAGCDEGHVWLYLIWILLRVITSMLQFHEGMQASY